MPAGDAERVWFPEMLDRLREAEFAWDDWPAISHFCGQMTEYRSSLRQAKGIADRNTVCPECGGRMSSFNGISIRSLLFAARKIHLLTTVELNELDTKWAKYRRTKNLDKFARPAAKKKVKTNNKSSCQHED